MSALTRRQALLGGSTVVIAGVAGCLGDSTDEWAADQPLSVATATQYQGPTCACCDAYADYLDDHLETELAVEVTDDLAAVKDDFEIDPELRGCHTVELEDSLVEGHVPVDVIGSFLTTESDARGIALPGMPRGSPGMGGRKDETWTIYELGAESAVFTEV